MWSITLTGAAAQAAFTEFKQWYQSDGDEDEDGRRLTRAEIRDFKNRIESRQRLYDYYMQRDGYIPEWLLLGIEMSNEELYQIKSDAISIAAMGIMPFTILKSTTWFSNITKVIGSTTKINSVESLIQGVGRFERLSGGVRQGFINGNADAIFKSITKGGNILPSGAVKMPNGTIVRLYNATSTGAPTIYINTSSQFYKIRITP